MFVCFLLSCRIIQQHLCYQMRQKGLRQNKSLSVIQLPFLKSECYICFPVKFVNVDGDCIYRDQWQPFIPNNNLIYFKHAKKISITKNLLKCAYRTLIEQEKNQNKNKNEETTRKIFGSNPMYSKITILRFFELITSLISSANYMENYSCYKLQPGKWPTL